MVCFTKEFLCSGEKGDSGIVILVGDNSYPGRFNGDSRVSGTVPFVHGSGHLIMSGDPRLIYRNVAEVGLAVRPDRVLDRR